MRRRFVLEISEPHKLDADDEVGCDKKNSVHSVSVIAAGVALVALLALFAVVFAIDGILPTPLTINDEKLYPDSFIAERAQEDLRHLTANGPRVTGSYENEVLAVEFLKRQISIITSEAHPNQVIEKDMQLVTGSYFLDYKKSGAVNAYSNVQNIIVRVGSKNNSPHSVLVNAHFDSVPTSPGGSDDGINCAAMLEILRKITKSPDRPEHNIIFLFNGAEETPLQAAHGFISQHKWASEARVLVNLEAAGHGGKAILFQTSPGSSWLSTYYNRVPHPFGQASGEEIFQSNLIPSDTDFRVFRYFGGLIGYDMAFARNGYRYHTKYDDFEHLPLGSYQHVGENTLVLVRALSNAPEVGQNDTENPDKIVYYDFLGWFMISYTETVAIIINVITVVLSLAVFVYSVYDFRLGFSKSSFIYLGLVFAAVIVGWVLSGAFLMFVAFVLDQIKYTMSWYRNPWILFGLYSAPVVAFSAGCLMLLNWYTEKSNVCINVKAQIQLHSVRIIWTIVLLIGTIAEIRSVYAIMLPVLFQTVAFIVVYLLKWQHTVRKWQILYLIVNIIPTMFLMYSSLLMLTLFIPISGRMGCENNPEILVALITLLMTILVTHAFVPLITLVRQPLIFLGSLCFLFGLAFILIFTPLAFPYSGNAESPAPQRFWIFHTTRAFHNETDEIIKKDSGFFFINMDRNSPDSVRHYVPQLENQKSVADDCRKYLVCGMPFVSIKMMGKTDAITWIPAPQPEITESPLGLTYTKTQVNKTALKYDVTVTGPDRQAIFISPVKDAKLTHMSLLEKLPEEALSWNDRDMYLILHTWGKQPTPLTFSFIIEVAENWNKPMVDVAVVGQYSDRKKIRFTPEYLKLIRQFPNWADVTPWVGAYESWTLQ